jgi:hypothetical protein
MLGIPDFILIKILISGLVSVKTITWEILSPGGTLKQIQHAIDLLAPGVLTI